MEVPRAILSQVADEASRRVGDSLAARFDALGSRMDALGANLEEVIRRQGALEDRVRAVELRPFSATAAVPDSVASVVAAFPQLSAALRTDVNQMVRLFGELTMRIGGLGRALPAAPPQPFQSRYKRWRETYSYGAYGYDGQISPPAAAHPMAPRFEAGWIHVVIMGRRWDTRPLQRAFGKRPWRTRRRTRMALLLLALPVWRREERASLLSRSRVWQGVCRCCIPRVRLQQRE